MISQITYINFRRHNQYPPNIIRHDPNKIKIKEKSYKNIVIYHNSYVTPTNTKASYFIINKVNYYIDEHNGNKYLTLLYTDKGKETLKTYRELTKNQRPW